MKERPILFSTAMIQAIFEGRKTQTRRILKKQPTVVSAQDGFKFFNVPKIGPIWSANDKCPYGQAGDILWVRETWLKQNEIFKFLADNLDWKGIFKFKPSIHMPKAAARLFLQLQHIRLERLQDISIEDALSEGVFYHEGFQGYTTDNYGSNFHCSNPVLSFTKLWISINGQQSWDDNPWVWVLSFKRIEK